MSPRLLNLINAFSSKSNFKNYFLKKFYKIISKFINFFSLKLYGLNYFLATRNSNKQKKLFHKNYLVDRIMFSEAEINQIYKDLKIKKYIFENKSNKYFLYDYPKQYLEETNYAWGFDRKFYVELIEKKLSSKIKEIFDYPNYRIEHVWLYETPSHSSNINSEFHQDADAPGAQKCIIYISDVDEESGPFSIYDREFDKKIKITGEKGTLIFFNGRECPHAGLPTLKKNRVVLSFCFYPTLRNNLIYYEKKPLNALHSFNPFTKFS